MIFTSESIMKRLDTSCCRF